jgi:hypothetical protein
MNKFAEYNQFLKKLIEAMLINQNMHDAVNLDISDGILRSYLSKEKIYSAGAFFTGQNLATLVVDSLKQPITFSSVVLDPTCGTGNLLIECSRKLDIEKQLSETLKKWGRVLWGFDIHETFVESCKLRLIIEALLRGCKLDCSFIEALDYLKNIKLKDALNVQSDELKSVTHLIMNPPFNLWPSPETGIWKKGKVNAAGIVFEHFINLVNLDCCISAVLPDVLRSGSRYENFRSSIAEKISGICEVWGRFNKQADVDVFVLSGFKVTNKGNIKWHQKISVAVTLADKFDVCIGPLVHYRDPEIGCEYPYLHAKNVTNWNEMNNIDEKRRFRGRVIAPPFVVVKRTSSPSDLYRAAAAIINVEDKAVAVENHLIVLKPKSGKLQDCIKVMELLASDFVNKYLNERIRLRHLTVNVIKSIPLF